MTSATMSAVGRPKREAMFASSLSSVCAGASERGGGSMWSTAPAWRDVFGQPVRLRHGSHKVSAPAKNTRPKPTIHRMVASAA